MKASRRICAVLSLLLLSLMRQTAMAQEKPITVESSTMQPSVLLGRPMLTWWDVKVRVPGLMVGQLRFDIKFENQLLATAQTEEFTFSAPGQRIRVMLPAIDSALTYDRLDVDIYFQGKKFTGLVSQQVLRIPFATKKVFVGLVGESKIVRKRSAERDQVLDRLKFENIIPKPVKSRLEDADRDLVKTIFASIDPVDFPADPLSYCGYDLIVLMGDEFRGLRNAQLEGILAWVRAGGSLYLEPSGVLEPYHVAFLRSLIADDPQGWVIELDSTGKLLSDTVPLDQFAVALVSGLGHAAIRIEDSDNETRATPADWLAIVGPLWNARKEPKPGPPLSYPMPGLDGQPVMTNRPNPDPWGLLPMNTSRFRLQQSDLLDRLMPEGVRMVPASVLATILFVFIVLIGPGDYFILGWLRVRKLTWLTFPAATLAVTALTVWVSNRYMSSGEMTHATEIRDLGPSGDVVRTNRFELLFLSSSRRVTTDVEKELFAPLSTSGDLSLGGYGPQGQFATGYVVTLQNGQSIRLGANSNAYNLGRDGQVVPAPTKIQGRIPGHFNVFQDLGKWTPQLNRKFAIPGTTDKPQIDWVDFQLPFEESQAIDRRQLPKRLSDAASTHFGPQAMVACFHGSSGWAYDRATGWRSTRWKQGNQIAVTDMFQQLQILNGTNFKDAPGEADFFRWIYQASVSTPDPGLFTLIKQTTPKGGAACDDLLLLDSSDPKAWLLVVVVPEKGDYVIYRKLMRFRD